MGKSKAFLNVKAKSKWKRMKNNPKNHCIHKKYTGNQLLKIDITNNKSPARKEVPSFKIQPVLLIAYTIVGYS